MGLDHDHSTRVRSHLQKSVERANSHFYPVTVSEAKRSIFPITHNDVLTISIGTMGYLVCTITLKGGYNYSIASQITTEMLTSGLVVSTQHCQALLYILGSFSILSMCSTWLLFFYRVRAVYGNSKNITYAFGFLWVATFGMSFVFPFSTSGGESPSTSTRPLQTFSPCAYLIL